MTVDRLFEARPEVGLFWIEPNGEITGEGSSDFHGSEVVRSGQYLNHGNNHSRYWPKDFHNKYDQKELSKGRVSKREDTGRFIVELPTELKNNVEIRDKVLRYFSLPRRIVDFEFYAHHDRGNFNPGEYK